MNMDGTQVFVASPPLVFEVPTRDMRGKGIVVTSPQASLGCPAAVCGGASFRPEVPSLYEAPKFKERAF